MLNDAGISSLIIDPNPMFVERALALLEQVDSLQQILTIGPVPDALKHVAVDLSAEAAKYQPQPLVAADLPPDQVIGLTYAGGTTGKPKGVIGTAQSIATMTSIQLAEWEWPANPRFLMCTRCRTPARRFHADGDQGRRDDSAGEVRPGRGTQNH